MWSRATRPRFAGRHIAGESPATTPTTQSDRFQTAPPFAAEVQHHPFPAGILRPPNYLPRIRQESLTAVKILLVEDSKLDRLRVSECLDESGFEYVVAENGTDAWEYGYFAAVAYSSSRRGPTRSSSCRKP